MQSSENVLEVTDHVKAKLKEIEPGLPGVKVVPVYDRSVLIHRTITNTQQPILEVVVTVVMNVKRFDFQPRWLCRIARLARILCALLCQRSMPLCPMQPSRAPFGLPPG